MVRTGGRRPRPATRAKREADGDRIETAAGIPSFERARRRGSARADRGNARLPRRALAGGRSDRPLCVHALHLDHRRADPHARRDGPAELHRLHRHRRADVPRRRARQCAAPLHGRPRRAWPRALAAIARPQHDADRRRSRAVPAASPWSRRRCSERNPAGRGSGAGSRHWRACSTSSPATSCSAPSSGVRSRTRCSITGAVSVVATLVVLELGGGISGMLAVVAATAVARWVWSEILARARARRLRQGARSRWSSRVPPCCGSRWRCRCP